MDRRQATRLSKFLSLVLRHRPDDYGLRMDDRGGVDMSDLIDVLVAEDVLAEEAEECIRELCEGSERRRFAIEDGRVRALYGHSSRVRLNLPEHSPPETLYHGTTGTLARRFQSIGLLPEDRAHVHLSGTREEALSVGRRHTDYPVLLEIDTAFARSTGVKFSQASEVIWLSDAIPVEAIRFPVLEAEAVPPPRPVASTQATVPSVRSAPAPSGVRMLTGEGDAEGDFKRRTKKKATGRR